MKNHRNGSNTPNEPAFPPGQHRTPYHLFLPKRKQTAYDLLHTTILTESQATAVRVAEKEHFAPFIAIDKGCRGALPGQRKQILRYN